MKPAERTRDDGEERFDLVGETVRSILFESADLSQTDSDSIINSSLDSLVSFMDRNVEVLSGVVKSYSDSPNKDDLVAKVRETIAENMFLAQETNSVQFQKEKLAFLFKARNRVGRRFDEDEDEFEDRDERSSESQSPSSRPESRSNDLAISDEEYEKQLKQITYDLDEWREEIGQFEPHRQFTTVLTELLYDPDWTHLYQGWPDVLEYFKSIEDPQFTNSILEEIAGYLKETDNQEIQEIALVLIGKLDVDRLLDTITLFKETALETSILDRFLDECIKQDRVAALDTLLEIYKNHPNYRVQAETRLLELGQSPCILAQWALKDPDSFCDKQLPTSSMSGVPTKMVRKAFRDAVPSATKKRVLALLERLPKGTDGVDQIIYAVLESGTATLRAAALPQLARFPGTVAVNTVIGVIKNHNLRGGALTAEIEAALKTLPKFTDNKATMFVEEVLQSRSWFRPVYSRDIRQLLRSIVK